MHESSAWKPSSPSNKKFSRRQFLAASAGVAALSAFEWTPIFQVPAASAQSTLTPPPNFPSSMPLYQQAFQNWSGEIVLENAWTCAPTSAADVVTLANWAFPVGYEVRAQGHDAQLVAAGHPGGFQRRRSRPCRHHPLPHWLSPSTPPVRLATVTAQTGVTMDRAPPGSWRMPVLD